MTSTSKELKMTLRQFFTTQKWGGKLIGAALGFLIAGPAGAVFGLFIGNFFDRGLAEYYARPYWHYHTESRSGVKKIFLEATFTVMGLIAKSDGRVSKDEINMARSIMQDMRLSKRVKKQAIDDFNNGKSGKININQIVYKLKTAVQDNIELLQLFVDIQYRIALVDELTATKLSAINQVLTNLGFAPLQQQHKFYDDFTFHNYQQSHTYQHKQSHSSYTHKNSSTASSLGHAYAVLGIPPSSSKQAVKLAYRKLISKHHPDKLAAKGLSEAEIKKANEKTQQICKAYQRICESKNW